VQIAVIFLAVAGYIYVLYEIPKLRIAGAIFAVALFGGLGVYLATTDPETELEINRISTEQVSLSELKFNLGVRTSELSGRVINNSDDYTLTGLSLVVRLFDCPGADSPLDECFVIGEDDGLARATVPPGQLRDFKATLLFNGLPVIEGVMRWDYQVIGTRALDHRAN